MTYYIGCAGWSVPSHCKAKFPEQGTHLERYAEVFNAVEINSSFYRPHQPKTYARWRESVSQDFRFAVKVPKTITHEKKFVDCRDDFKRFLFEVGHLEDKLGPLLVQLPPSFAFKHDNAATFFALLRASFVGEIVLEARHLTWFDVDVQHLLFEHNISRVAADPPVTANVAKANMEPSYFRLHGFPDVYFSKYSDKFLASLSEDLRSAHRSASAVWCIFDNTGLGHATTDAIETMALLQAKTLQRTCEKNVNVASHL